MCLTQTIFFFAALQTPRFYNPSGAVAPAPFAQGSLLVCANIANNYKLRWQGRIPYPPAPTQSNFFRNCINFSARFFFVSAGAKKKLTKRNALFQRKLFEKSFLWTLSKTFPRCRRNVGRAHPKLRTSRPAAPQVPPFCKRRPRRVPFHSLIYLAAVSAAWVRASSGAAPCRIAAAKPAKKLSPAPTVV